ncbi:MAG: hypothetical protein JSR82_00425 [Verrucomicrobia bacterium]|nr:hypothetical protein [Verrucomicrobiota bacterium]
MNRQETVTTVVNAGALAAATVLPFLISVQCLIGVLSSPLSYDKTEQKGAISHWIFNAGAFGSQYVWMGRLQYYPALEPGFLVLLLASFALCLALLMRTVFKED